MARTIRKRDSNPRYAFATEDEFNLSSWGKTYANYLSWMSRDHASGTNNAPKFFRQMLNRRKRAAMNQPIKNWKAQHDIENDIEIPKSKRDANWIWF